MKPKLMLSAAVGLLYAVCLGQRTTETFYLPDSLSGVSNPRIIFHCPAGNKVFVGGDGTAIIVLDGQTSEKIARIPADGAVTDMCYDGPMNKVYAICSSSLLAIDAASNQLVGLLPLGHDGDELCYNPATNRVYAVADDHVLAVDCDGDSVVATIGLPSPSEDICCNPVRNKVYCVMSSDDVAVIDCATDSLVKTFYTGAGDYDMVYDSTNDHLYICEAYDEDVAVIDCARDSVLRYLPAGYTPDTMCLSTVSNKLYVPDLTDQYLYIMSCAHDTTAKWVDVGERQTCIAYDSVDNLVYFGMEGTDSLAALSCVTDSVVNKVALPFEPATLGYDPQNNLLYAGGDGDLVVLAGGTGEVVASLKTWFPPLRLAYRAEGNKLYCSEEYGNGLAIVDAVSGVALGFRRVGDPVTSLSQVMGNDKLYCGTNGYTGDSALYVVDCATDSVRKVASVGTGLADFCYNPAGNKVYCANSGYYDSVITVLDGESDSILRRVRIGNPTDVLAYNPTWNKVYATTYERQVVTVLDADRDSIVVHTAVPFYPSGVLYVERESLACCYGRADSVAFIDGMSNQLVEVTQVAGTPDYALYNPVGNKLYLASDYYDTVSVIDMATLQLAALIPVSSPTGALEFDSAANRVYCLGASGYHVVTVIDGRSDTVIGEVQTLPWPGRTAWAGPLRRLFVSQPDYSVLTVITDTSHVGVLERGTAGRGRAGASVVRGVLFQPANGDGRRANSELLDITGRRVLVLRPGPNDVSGLADGVYFVREEPQAASLKPQALRRVVITR